MTLRPRHLSLVAFAALVCASVATARDDAAPVGHHAVMIDTAAAFLDPARTAARREVIVLQGDRTAEARRLKAHNKRLVVLAYLDLSAMSPALPSGFSTGVQTHAENWKGKVTNAGAGYAARNERWYLHDRAGRRFTFRAHNWLWAANISDRGYQRRWASNAVRMLAARPEFDGVFIDDVNPTLRYHHDPADVRELPTDEAYAAATGAALAVIVPAIRSLDRLVYANLGAWTDYGEQIRPWLRHLDGAMDEQWVKFGNRRGSGWRDEAGWARQVANVADASASGVSVMTVTHSANNDSAAARYGYASALLAARGRVLFSSVGNYHSETWFPDYERDLGAPTGPMTGVQGGVRSRAFTRGLVVVNPTGLPQRAEFGAAHSGSGLRGATGATLGPHSALILTADAG